MVFAVAQALYGPYPGNCLIGLWERTTLPFGNAASVCEFRGADTIYAFTEKRTLIHEALGEKCEFSSIVATSVVSGTSSSTSNFATGVGTAIAG